MLSRHSAKALSQLSKLERRCLHTSRVVCSSQREYLHMTKIPTYHFQDSLPRLPIPALEKTCDRYLRAQIPLTTPTEHAELEKVVRDFQNGKGKDLHEELVATDKKNKHTSYISDMWTDVYLADRRPLQLNHNPFITFVDDPKPGYNTQLIRAANMLISSTRIMKTLRDEQLEPEVYHLNPKKSNTDTFRTVCRLLPSSLSWYGAYLFKAFPLDMVQYKRLFNSTRIPRFGRDELYTDKTAKHVLVLRKGNIYAFDMLDKDGNIIPETEVLAHLNYILNDDTPPPEYPISILTSQDRNTWAEARVQLINADPYNEFRLKMIDGAQFALCLDDDQPSSFEDMTRCFLHGDGVNRWFDKSFQLFITKEGTTSLQFEHAWGDGVAVMRYFKEVFADSTQKPWVHPDTKPAPNANSERRVQRLDFTLDPYLKETIKKSKTKFDEVTGSLNISFMIYEQLKKNDLKETKLSPDAIMQLVLQLAHYRLFGKNVGTYESCSTSAFKHGRTETVRPCSVATDAMCKMLYGKDGPQGSPEAMFEGIKECSRVHGQLTKEAAMGQGFDRHLFALRKYAERKDMTLPMFTHPAYQNLNHIILSTSTLYDPSVQIGGFAAVVPDGYGIGYAIADMGLGFNITCYPAKSAQDLIDSIIVTLDDLQDILNGRKPACKRL